MTEPVEPSKPRPRSIALHLVAIYGLYHAASIVIGSIPAPFDAKSRTAWSDPTVQDEFALWADRLRRIGLEVSPEKLEETAWQALGIWMRGVEAIGTPFRAYQAYTATYQSWSMFVAPHRYPARLQVSIYADGQWRDVYVARSPCATWRRAALDHIRMRSAIFRYAWPHYRGRYQQFCDWLARQAARDFSSAERVRVRYLKRATPPPAEFRAGRIPADEMVGETVLDLDAYR